MPKAKQNGPAPSAIEEGEAAAAELKTALAGAGFTFPSLRGDWPLMEHGHVQLGGMSAEAAREFAAWVRSKTGQKPQE